MDVSARFADEEEKEKFKADGYRSIPTENGEVILADNGLTVSENIRLGLLKFFWGARITVRGVRAN